MWGARALKEIIQKFNEYLRNYLNESRSNWKDCLTHFTYCYNITPNSSLNLRYTPYKLVFVEKPNALNILLDNKKYSIVLKYSFFM